MVLAQAAVLALRSRGSLAQLLPTAAIQAFAGDVIDTLTLNMNRIRQASITKEIIEVVSGAAAAN